MDIASCALELCEVKLASESACIPLRTVFSHPRLSYLTHLTHLTHLTPPPTHRERAKEKGEGDEVIAPSFVFSAADHRGGILALVTSWSRGRQHRSAICLAFRAEKPFKHSPRAVYLHFRMGTCYSQCKEAITPIHLGNAAVSYQQQQQQQQQHRRLRISLQPTPNHHEAHLERSALHREQHKGDPVEMRINSGKRRLEAGYPPDCVEKLSTSSAASTNCGELGVDAWARRLREETHDIHGVAGIESHSSITHSSRLLPTHHPPIHLSIPYPSLLQAL
ncbi:hypothetical protein TSMEX_001911 [Taenia solium]|eukprot:TsM_001135900 transcript=TsM_001135900 gene=TsM_001135900